MALKKISLLLLGTLSVQAVDSNEALKAMSKFAQVPATRMTHPAIPVDNGATFATGNDALLEKLEMKVRMADLEKRSQNVKAEYQHLRADIEKLSQADVNASISAPSSYNWLGASIASLGLAATMGLAAVKKYMRPATAVAPRAGRVVMQSEVWSEKNFRLTLPLGVFLPLAGLVTPPDSPIAPLLAVAIAGIWIYIFIDLLKAAVPNDDFDF